MKRVRILVWVLCGFVQLQMGQAQSWVEGMQDPQANLFQVQAEFNEYFSLHSTEKGSGWKQFKRWEYYHALRIDESGKLRNPDSLLIELQQYEDRRRAGKRNSQQGSWRELGPFFLPSNATGQPNGMGRIACIAFHPSSPTTLYAGAASGGIWKSTNQGQGWSKISDGLVRLGVSAIAVHPTTPDVIYIGTGDRDNGDAPGLGVWRSTDGGSNWTTRNSGMGNLTVYNIRMHPTNSNILIASAYQGIYRSTNGGASWTRTLNGHNCKDLLFHPTNPNIVYAAGTNVYRSTNNGVTWTQVSSGLPSSQVVRIDLAVSAGQPGYVYALVAGSQGFAGLFRSVNAGVSFSQRASSPNILGHEVNGGTGHQGWYDLVLTADPDSADVLYAGGINLWKSSDGGQNWRILTHWYGAASLPAVHADDHVLEWSPHTGDLYLGHDGGIHRSTNAGVNWADISNGLAVAQVYKIGTSATDESRIINGYQDNGTAILSEGHWRTGIGGDGMEAVVDYTHADVVYGSLYYGEIRRSTNGGVSFLTIGKNGVNGINENGGWVTPFCLHPQDPNSMLAGYDNLWRSDNVKSRNTTDISWRQISNFSGAHDIVDFAISPSNPDVVYVSRWGSDKLFRSGNAQATSPVWVSLQSRLPVNLPAKDIEIDPSNPDRLWIALGNDIYHSSDAGQTWTDLSGTLPNISLNSIVYDHRSPLDALYIGMDAGVYYRDSTLSDWIPFDMGLPNVEVTDLEIYYDEACSDDKLRAGTYGRGLWETDLKSPGQTPPVACFQASQTEVCDGMVVILKDLSPNYPSSWQWQISPANHYFVNGTSASSPVPHVVFSASGTYGVRLQAANVYGAAVENRPALITVDGSTPLLPLTESFEGGALCSSSSNCGGTICLLPGGWTNAENGVEDDIDWRVNAGGTPSSLTGPSVDANLGSAAGRYLYLEASGNCYEQEAQLLSPCIDLRSVGTADVSFSVHMYGSSMGSLALDVLHDGQWEKNVFPGLSGNLGNSWRTISASLNAFVGQVVRLRFRGVTGNGYYSDLALDNIVVHASILATEISSFQGSYLEHTGNLLFWETLHNTPGETMVLERQSSAGEFLPLTRMPVTGADHYEYLDLNPYSGSNFYRLAIIDLDGEVIYSPIVEVVSPQEEEWVRVFPTPFTSTLWVEVLANENADLPLWVKDVQGKVVHRQLLSIQARRSQFLLDLEQLPAGVYFLEVEGKAYKAMKR